MTRGQWKEESGKGGLINKQHWVDILGTPIAARTEERLLFKLKINFKINNFFFHVTCSFKYFYSLLNDHCKKFFNKELLNFAIHCYKYFAIKCFGIKYKYI